LLPDPHLHPQSAGALAAPAPAQPRACPGVGGACPPRPDSLCPVTGGDIAKHQPPYVIREPTDHEGNHHSTCKVGKKAITLHEQFFIGGEKRDLSVWCLSLQTVLLKLRFVLLLPLCKELITPRDNQPANVCKNKRNRNNRK